MLSGRSRSRSRSEFEFELELELRRARILDGVGQDRAGLFGVCVLSSV